MSIKPIPITECRVSEHNPRGADAYTNSIEGFWSQLKRSLDGTHHAVSPKFLQQYVDEFVWRYNHRGETLFSLLVAEVAKRCVSSVGSLVVKS